MATTCRILLLDISEGYMQGGPDLAGYKLAADQISVYLSLRSSPRLSSPLDVMFIEGKSATTV